MLQLILRVQLTLFESLSAIRTVHVVAQRVFMHLEVTTAAARMAFAADKPASVGNVTVNVLMLTYAAHYHGQARDVLTATVRPARPIQEHS